MNVFVSSVAFENRSILEIERLAIQHELAVEFSANFTPDENLRSQFTKLTIDRLAHNYFPPPKEPFVLNLASQNEDILQRSREHCIQGIELATNCKLKYFSAHAGFCLDPDPNLLGKKLVQPDSIDRGTYWQTFIDSCKLLSEVSKRKGVKFLFENNVLMRANLRSDGVNPLLCVDPDEIRKALSELNSDSLGFLLDTAHLQVSANSLGFDKNDAIDELKQKIDYIHHSDNDGLSDSNQPITHDYWFLNHLKDYKSVPHVVEVKNQRIVDIKDQIALIESHIS